MLVEAALEIARRRHMALTSDDLEGYAASDAEMADHCSRLTAVAGDALTSADRAALGELLALELASSRALAQLSIEVANRLATLAARSRTNTAYLRAERSSVNPL